MASGVGPNTNAWLLHPALPLDVRLLGLGAGAVIVGAWATVGEAPLQSLRGRVASGRMGDARDRGGGGDAGLSGEAVAGGLDLDLDGAGQTTAGGEGQEGTGAFLEDSAPSLLLEGLNEEPPTVGTANECLMQGEVAEVSPPYEQAEAPTAEDLGRAGGDLLPKSPESAEEVPRGDDRSMRDATVISEDGMKAISDLIAKAVGAGTPSTIEVVDPAEAAVAPETSETDELSSDPGSLRPSEVSEPAEDEVRGPEDATTEASLSPTAENLGLPTRADEGGVPTPEEAVTTRRGASSEARAVPRRTVEEVLEATSPGDLVGRALMEGEDIREQWELYGAMHRQAAADAEFVAEALKLVQDAYEGELGKVESEAEAFEAISQALEEKLGEVVQECEATVAQTNQRAQKELVEGLEKQKKDLTLAATLDLVEERKGRIKQVDLLREQVNALHLTFQQLSEERKESHSVHKITLGMLILGDVLRQGEPISEAANLLHIGVSGDPLVEAALASLPERALENGVATREELQQWFSRVRSEVSKVALVPEAGGAVIHSLSTLASAFRLREHGAAGVEVAGVEGVLSRAEALVKVGLLVQAADLLEGHFAGSEGGRAAALWVQSARDRMVVEQAAAIIFAHATALNAGLV